MAQLLEINLGLSFRKSQNYLRFRVSAPFSSSLTTEFRIKGSNLSYLQNPRRRRGF
jgi:hypothetical protein